MAKCVVVNIKNSKYDVYIGRPSIWGNPFSSKIIKTSKYKTNNRIESIEKYKEYILNNKELLNQLYLLQGKRLGCFCKPKTCHGDILSDLVNNLTNKLF